MRRAVQLGGSLLAAVLLCCACSPGARVALKPWLVPIELSVNSAGEFEVTAGFTVATPIGALEFSGGLTSQLASGHTLLEIDYPASSGRRPAGFDLAEDGSASVCLDGRFAMAVSSDRIQIGVLSDTSRIAIVDSSSATETCASYQTPTAVADASVGAGNSARSFDVTGTWVGTYTCSQGLTGLTLTVSGDDSALSAEFAFYATDNGDPSVPPGSFRMTGVARPRGIELRQQKWITKPNGYAMVDLTATAPADDDDSLDGNIDSATPGCTSVHLRGWFVCICPLFVWRWRRGPARRAMRDSSVRG